MDIQVKSLFGSASKLVVLSLRLEDSHGESGTFRYDLEYETNRVSMKTYLCKNDFRSFHTSLKTLSDTLEGCAELRSFLNVFSLRLDLFRQRDGLLLLSANVRNPGWLYPWVIDCDWPQYYPEQGGDWQIVSPQKTAQFIKERSLSAGLWFSVGGLLIDQSDLPDILRSVHSGLSDW